MKKAAVILLLVLLTAAFALPGSADMNKYSTVFMDTFDTVISLIGYAENQETFNARANETHAMYLHLHKMFDTYNSYADEGIGQRLRREPQGGKRAGPSRSGSVRPVDLLQEPLRAGQRQTNVAMGSVLSIWHEYREAGLDDPDNAKLPPMEDLQAAAQHMDINNLILDAENQTVYFADPEMKLDVGAVAKGYATELVAQTLLASDMPSFIISAGGNVRMGNPPADGRAKWGVGIQDPDGAVLGLSDIVETLYLTGCSVVTSGDYQRYYVVDGQRYHHLIDPDTLMPDTDFRSVSIITEDSGYADLLSTAAFLMPYEESRAFIDSLDGVEAIWLFPDGSKKMTFGAMNVAKSCGATNQ